MQFDLSKIHKNPSKTLHIDMLKIFNKLCVSKLPMINAYIMVV